MSGVPLLIFANKQDLVQALQPDEVAVNLDRFWNSWICKILRTENGLLQPVLPKHNKASRMDYPGSLRMSENDSK